ncbi:MAG TPA: pirin family protein [Candidatus Binatia bacterium]|nr:pirin family protein [Candidatus Binatia bacterium]
MITIRRSDERGRSKFDWLDSRHTFSFGGYYDPQHMGFSDLRVINEDRVAPGGGFPTHSHRDMEIVTYVLEGALAHTDSTGTSSVIRVGDVQRMSAGTGISHSEYNASQTEPVHFLQIWIIPKQPGLQPGYEQRSFEIQKKSGSWVLVAAPDARDGAVKVHQDAELWLAAVPQGGELNYTFRNRRRGWLQVLRGSVSRDGASLRVGDGAAIHDEHVLNLSALEQSELLLFDLS